MTSSSLLNDVPPTASRPGSGALRKLARRALPAAALLVAIGLLGAGVQRYRRARATAPVHYDTVTVARGLIDAKVTATGAVSPLITVQVGSQVSGRIASLNADFGSKVSQGQTIATIEPSLFRAAVAQGRANYDAARANVAKARAAYDEAEREYARSKALLADGLVTRADYDSAQAKLAVAAADIRAGLASVAQARAALDQVELNLKYTTIVSPIDGIVISRNVDVGQTVAATLQAPTLFTIAQDLSKMQVDANVAEADVGHIAAGLAVTFNVDAYPGRDFYGKVRQIRDNAQTIQNVVTYDAVIDVDNAERLLKPGMTANVTFSYARREDALRVPNTALRFKPDAATVNLMLATDHAPLPTPKRDERLLWILRADKPTAILARIGIADNTGAELLAGDVRPGDRVVVEASAQASAAKPAP